ncbi:MAG: Peptidase S26B, signal peptidase [Candidatus Roizmanbacteria bacterium GW2011_GWA2_37_7]|uniref:Signal peptidase I n=1 Tax=Candidatus Roizmanbacteria bacterium GW2011_GWA2_37_7 TaxID=1618481 RepID=A0A0G0HEJ8_9BACT|nr:MAG: Peptidase S26B, signal peptidase [Candidatus Roizmanbacteria bacterium GW2011_GWA2_37_7]
MKIIHIFLNVVSYLFFLLLLIVGFLTLSSNTSLLGSYESLLVRSGSMEPTIMTGDVIFAKQLNQYNKNDVVAFKDEGDRVITHRIVKIDESDGQLTFITKGDANQHFY